MLQLIAAATVGTIIKDLKISLFGVDYPAVVSKERPFYLQDEIMADFKIESAPRIKRLPPYLFGRLNALKQSKRQAGIDIIDLGMGNPSDAVPQVVIDKLCEAARSPRNHRYSASKGIKNLRREVAKKYERKWNVELDPESIERLATWIDANAVFYCTYDPIEQAKQLRGEVIDLPPLQ